MAFSPTFRGPGAARLCVRPADEADLDPIMAIERRPGYAAFVGRSEEREHRAMMATPGFAYRLGLGENGAPLAFAILSGIGDPHGNLYLKRIAAARLGEGLGSAFMALILAEAFGQLNAWRFHLDCFADNLRAQRTYAKLGFTRDGVLRQAFRSRNGARTDLVLMALLKPEWEAHRAGGDV